MKRRDLINKLKAAGYYQKKSGHKNPKHEPWTNGVHLEPIPWGREINETTANEILKRCGLK
jgi:hypothetical protein